MSKSKDSIIVTMKLTFAFFFWKEPFLMELSRFKNFLRSSVCQDWSFICFRHSPNWVLIKETHIKCPYKVKQTSYQSKEEISNINHNRNLFLSHKFFQRVNKRHTIGRWHHIFIIQIILVNLIFGGSRLHI